MKLKNVFQILGFRGAPKRYGYSVTDFDLPEFGKIRFARWNHPRETPKSVTAEAVLQYRRFLRSGDFCIDIGAHTGDSTVPMALAVGPTGTTLALEPNPYVYPVLEKNARLNRDRVRIIPLMAAAAEQEGELFFEYSDSGFCNGGLHKDMSAWQHAHPFKLAVHGINLAEELRRDFPDLLPKLRFIKTDAEGYDLFILRSIEDLIREYRPYVKAEVFRKLSLQHRSDLISFFERLGYEVHRVEQEPCVPGEVVHPSTAGTWEHYDILCLPR